MRWRYIATHYLSVYLFYFALAVIMTYPLIQHLDDSFAGGFLTDAYQISRHSWSIEHALANGNSPLDQSLMAYPDGMGGALIWANPFQFFPVWFFDIFMPLPMAYNLTLLLRLALNGWAMFFLVRYLSKGNILASILAGVIFLTYPAVQGRIYGGHLGVLFLWAMPLYLYNIYQLRDAAPRKLHFGLAVLFCTIAPLGNTSMLIFYVLPIVGSLLLYQLVTRQWQWFKWSLGATFVGMLGILVFLGPLIYENATNPQFNTDIGGIVRYSADALSLVTPSFEHPLYGKWQYTHDVLGISLVEGAAYVGILPFLLAGWGIIRQSQSRWLLILACGAWILSLGPLLKYRNELVLAHFTSLEGETWETYISLPLAWVQNLPVLDQARTPGRFSFGIGFALAILAGYGLTDVLDRWQIASHWRVAVISLLMVLVVGDYQVFWSMPYVDATIPTGITDLRDDDDIRAVFNVPWNDPILTKVGLYYQTGHEKPIITGQFVRDTPVSKAKLTLLQNTLDPALLKANGIDVVIVHGSNHESPHHIRAVDKLGEPVYVDNRVAIFYVPETDTPPEFSVIRPRTDVLERSLASYVYTPSAGWAVFSGQVSGDIGGVERDIVLTLEGEPFQTWTVNEAVDLDIQVPIYFPSVGFYEIGLAFEPECPHLTNASVQCRSLEATNIHIDQFTVASERDESVQFDHGLSLRYTFVEGDAEQVPQVWLWWEFDEALTKNDIRFVHIVDEEGQLADQHDEALPIDYTEVQQWGEMIALDFASEDQTGIYTIYTGWYTYNPPNFDRFAILSKGDYQDNLVEIASFTID